MKKQRSRYLLLPFPIKDLEICILFRIQKVLLITSHPPIKFWEFLENISETCYQGTCHRVLIAVPQVLQEKTPWWSMAHLEDLHLHQAKSQPWRIAMLECRRVVVHLTFWLIDWEGSHTWNRKPPTLTTRKRQWPRVGVEKKYDKK